MRRLRVASDGIGVAPGTRDAAPTTRLFSHFVLAPRTAAFPMAPRFEGNDSVERVTITKMPVLVWCSAPLPW